MKSRRVVWCATLLVAAVFTMHIVGCGEDNGASAPEPTPTPTPPILASGDTSPEDLILDMAKAAFGSVVGHEITAVLFPSPTIDFTQLINDFLEATQQLLTQQTITEQAGDINGDMTNLNNNETTWNAIPTPGKNTKEYQIYANVNSLWQAVNTNLGVLEQTLYASQGFSAWMLGAQVSLSALEFQIEMDPVLQTPDVVAADNTTLAINFHNFLTYAAEIRNSILYSNIQQVVGKVHSCSTENCNCYATGSGSYLCDTCQYYTDCDGHKHDWDTSDSSQCKKARSANIESCAANLYNTESQDLAWIDDVLNTWRDSLAGLADQIADVSKPCAVCQDAYSFITVDQAVVSITGDLPQGNAQDATEWFQAACNGQQTCDYKLAHADYGEPGPFTLVDVSYRCGSDTTQHTVNLSGTNNPLLAEGAYIHLDCAQRIANMQTTFRGQPVTGMQTETDVSTHSQHPNAGLITNGVYAPTPTPYNDTEYAVVLPYTGTNSALTIDFGYVQTICIISAVCGATIQADHDDVYQLDWSSDGMTWHSAGAFPSVSGSGLETRSLPNPSGTVTYEDARYFRVYANSGDNDYSVSELTLKWVDDFAASVGKPATGPEPFITNGQYAPASTAYNSAEYATILTGTGTANALHIDLGRSHYVSHVKVQADQNGVYQLDVSADNTNWTPWYTAPIVSGSGLQTRDSGTLAATLARYLRVYATSGDGKYSVSEVQVFANATLPGCNGLPNCGFSAAELILDQTGAPPTAQDLQDFVTTWTCGSDTTSHTTHAVPWNTDAVVSVTCAPSAVTCNPSQATTCSVFAPIIMENGNSAAQQRPDDVIYENFGTFTYPICVSSQYPQCTQVIAGKVNYYHTSSSSEQTHNDPACLNVQRAIHDAVDEGLCPAGVGANANTSENVWPYNLPLGGGQTSTCLPDPVLQPALLPFIGCGPYVQ